MGLLYSDLQVMGSLYVIPNLLPLTHLMGHSGAVQILLSLLLEGCDAVITEILTVVARIAGS